MIVHHRAGEMISGVMNRQYRTAFNLTTCGVASIGAPLTGLLLWHPLFIAFPATVLGATYLVNLRGRFARIRSNQLKPPSKSTEDEILELQDIYFHAPTEHQPTLEKLLIGAYQQIERGNPDGVILRLEQARAFQLSLTTFAKLADTQQDIKEVAQAVKTMRRSIEA